MGTVKLLIFSDVHGDAGALRRLMSIEADYYFCAGDLVNWSRGLDAMGELMKQHGDRMYVIPGNHESANQIADFCAKYGFHDFHGGRVQIGGFEVVGLGYSNPTPFGTPGEVSEEADDCDLPRAAVQHIARPDYEPETCGQQRGARFSAAGTAAIFLLRTYS